VQDPIQIAILIFALSSLDPARSGISPYQPLQTPESAHVVPPEARLDLNSASIEDLMKIPGMTHSWAARIIRFRPYRAKNELVDRGVVTTQIYDRIKDHVIAHRLK
jgi:DNA uptake protein ComE-like DNA-binding protein